MKCQAYTSLLTRLVDDNLERFIVIWVVVGVKRADGIGAYEPQMKDIISANDIMIGHKASRILLGLSF